MRLVDDITIRYSLKAETAKEKKQPSFWEQYSIFLVVALAVDVFTPFLIWKGVLPGATRWIADLAIAAMIVLVITRMLVFDLIPSGVLVIAGISIIGVIVAFYEGQSMAATAWGWWRMFKYPMVGVFVYLQPWWPEQFPERLRKMCVAILAVNVLLQLGQYATGEVVGDSLAGFFGRHGVGPLTMLIMFVLCLSFSRWLAYGDWKTLIFVMALGGIASGLAEIKLYPAALLALGGITFAIHMIRGGEFRKLILYVVILAVVATTFVSFYNVVVAEARGTRRLETYFEWDQTDSYLTHVNYSVVKGAYHLGRNFALAYGWNAIQRDAATFLFGIGLGARGSSQSLGIVGEGLQEGYYGTVSGTSLLVIMQELGVVGLCVLGGFIIWTVIAMIKDVRRNPNSEYTTLRYAVMLFTLFWPLWVWYHRAWDFGVAMFLYWGTLGYLLSKTRRRPILNFRSKFISPGEYNLR